MELHSWLRKPENKTEKATKGCTDLKALGRCSSKSTGTGEPNDLLAIYAGETTVKQ